MQKYFVTIKLCKCMLLGAYQELIGVDIYDELNTSEESKKTVFRSLDPSIAFSYHPMLLAMFRLYAMWIPFFEVLLLPW